MAERENESGIKGKYVRHFYNYITFWLQNDQLNHLPLADLKILNYLAQLRQSFVETTQKKPVR